MKTTLKKTKYSVHYFVRNEGKIIKQHRDFIQKRTAVQGFFKIKTKFGKSLTEIYVFDNETSEILEEYHEKNEETKQKK